MSLLRDKLTEISTIVCTIYPPTHLCLYSLKMMGIRGVGVKHKYRTPMDDSKRRRLNRLLRDIMQLDLGDQPYYIYDLHVRMRKIM